jgi:hypothetical protein
MSTTLQEMRKESETTQREQHERGHRRCGGELVVDFDIEEIEDYLHDKIGLTSLDCWFEWNESTATITLRGEFPIKTGVTRGHATSTQVLSDDQQLGSSNQQTDTPNRREHKMYPTAETEALPATEEIIQQVIEEAAASECPISLEITRNLDGSTSFVIAYHVEEYISHVEEFTVEADIDPSDALQDVLEKFLSVEIGKRYPAFLEA